MRNVRLRKSLGPCLLCREVDACAARERQCFSVALSGKGGLKKAVPGTVGGLRVEEVVIQRTEEATLPFQLLLAFLAGGVVTRERPIPAVSCPLAQPALAASGNDTVYRGRRRTREGSRTQSGSWVYRRRVRLSWFF